jgi:hypothetical protein
MTPLWCFCLAFLFLPRCASFQHIPGFNHPRTVRYSAGNDNVDNPTRMTRQELDEFGQTIGIRISSKVTGPFLRLEAFPLDALAADNAPIGYLTAFVRPYPLGLLQLDTIQVRNRRQTGRGGWNGLSFILGSYALIWAAESANCKRAQLLAVRDSVDMERALVKLYIADRLVWGATGSLLELDMEQFFGEWTSSRLSVMRQLEERRRKVDGGQGEGR